jgi:hypothetical protein
MLLVHVVTAAGPRIAALLDDQVVELGALPKREGAA